METLVLVFDAPAPDLDTLARDLREVGTVQADRRQVVVEKNDARVYLRVLNDSADEIFSDWPVTLIPSEAGIFALDYNRPMLARVVVCALAAERQFLLDTNYGAILRSDEFRRRAADDSWTWERWSM